MSYPVVGRRAIEPGKRGLFKGRRQVPELPRVDEGHVRLFKVDGRYVQSRTPGEINWGELEQVVEVDVRPMRTSFDVVVPSKTDAYSFSVEASVVCSVTDAVAAAAKGIDDMLPSIRSVVERALWSSGRSYDIEQSDACEQNMQVLLMQATTGGGGLVGSGLNMTSASVHIRLDDASKAHIRKLKEIERQEQVVRAEHQTTKTAEQLALERQVAKAKTIAEATSSADGALSMAAATGELSFADLAKLRVDQQERDLNALSGYQRRQVTVARVIASLSPDEQKVLEGKHPAIEGSTAEVDDQEDAAVDDPAEAMQDDEDPDDDLDELEK